MIRIRKVLSATLVTCMLALAFTLVLVPAVSAKPNNENDSELSSIPEAGSNQDPTIFVEGFEGVFPGVWIVGDSNPGNGIDYWADVSYRSYSGGWSGWCAAIGMHDGEATPNYNPPNNLYDDYMGAFMYRSVDLSGYTSASLSYKYWVSCEPNLDFLEVIYHSGGSWHYVDRKTGWDNVWRSSTVSIPTTAIYVGFKFTSDVSYHGEGAYVDDVILTASSVGVSFADGFESGSFSKWSGTGKTYGETASVVSTLKHHGVYSARFTSNGGGGTERAYCYKNIASSSVLYARGYFYVSKSGIVQNDDFINLIIFRAGSNMVATAGWKKTGGVVKWFIGIRHGTSWVNAYSVAAGPKLNQWYCVELRWEESSTGSGFLWVNGAMVCSITGKNTAAYGDANQVRFGLAGVNKCGPTTANCDCARIASTYIGPE